MGMVVSSTNPRNSRRGSPDSQGAALLGTGSPASGDHLERSWEEPGNLSSPGASQLALTPAFSLAPSHTSPPPHPFPCPPCRADGMRYGTLCVVDLKRRSFSAEMYALLINFANLVVQGEWGEHREAAHASTGYGCSAMVSLALLFMVHSSSEWPLLLASRVPCRAGARRCLHARGG